MSKHFLTDAEEMALCQAKWGQGEWSEEPNEWVGRFFTYHVVARRNMVSGHWCGYVWLPDGHPLIGKNTDECTDALDVHGGVTFADDLDDKGFAVGFDCGHYYDIMPMLSEAMSGIGKYRNLGYIKTELKNLARQIKEAHRG